MHARFQDISGKKRATNFTHASLFRPGKNKLRCSTSKYPTEKQLKLYYSNDEQLASRTSEMRFITA